MEKAQVGLALEFAYRECKQHTTIEDKTYIMHPVFATHPTFANLRESTFTRRHARASFPNVPVHLP